MQWLNFFKPGILNVGISLGAFLILAFILPLIPIMELVTCAEPVCPSIPKYYTIPQAMQSPQIIVAFRWITLAVEVLFTYIIVSIAVGFVGVAKNAGEPELPY